MSNRSTSSKSKQLELGVEMQSTSKIKIFLWKIKHGISLTKYFLVHGGMQISVMCPLSGSAEEDLVHLFWDCYLADVVWKLLEEWLGINLIPLFCSDFNLDHIFNINIIPDIRTYWKVFTSEALWVIWRVRNECIFRNVKKEKKAITFLLKSTVFKRMGMRQGINLRAKGISGLWDINWSVGY